jgi:hypothetical protein
MAAVAAFGATLATSVGAQTQGQAPEPQIV